MLQFIYMGGPLMWPLVIFALIIIGLTVKKAIELFGQQEVNSVKMETGINAILFWGMLSAIVGYFGHYLGVYNAMQAISRANDISPGIVAMGYGISLITILTGLTILMFAVVIWFILKWRFKKLVDGNK